MLYLPFLVLDMVVASVLMAMGMMMLPPAVISLPFKLLLFVLVDGWDLVVGSLGEEFRIRRSKMTEEMVMSLASEAIKTTIYIAGPLLLAAMAIGILVSLLQAITQINESTLTFIPKMIAVIIVLMVMGPWMLETSCRLMRLQSSAEQGRWIR